jgi:hypothetical protein
VPIPLIAVPSGSNAELTDRPVDSIADRWVGVTCAKTLALKRTAMEIRASAQCKDRNIEIEDIQQKKVRMLHIATAEFRY